MTFNSKDKFYQRLIAQNSNIDIYLVGGAVRDALLGIPTQDLDWVVVGATAENMIQAGFQSVGRDFPVYIHPATGEEYALARQERKTAPGYQGFSFNTDAQVSLEDDLKRRDFTINAITKDINNKLIDPLGGVQDLNQKTIRHISNAFIEDPLRVLRAARFAAKFFPIGFKLADNTLTCLKEMATSGELQALTPERVWLETFKALETDAPDVYFRTLQQVGALKMLFPEFDAADRNATDSNAIKVAANLSRMPEVRFAALAQNVRNLIQPKGSTPDEKKIKSVTELTAERIELLCSRLRVPNTYLELALKVARYHNVCDQALETSATELLGLLQNLDAFRKPKLLEQFLIACKAICYARQNLSPTSANSQYPQADFLRKVYQACQSVTAQPFINQGFKGKTIGEKIAEKRRILIQGLK